MAFGGLRLTWFLALTAEIAELGSGHGLSRQLGLDSDSVAELTLWFVLPYATLHGLAVTEEHADLLLEMEDDHCTERLCARVAATPQCRRSACTFGSFRAFVRWVWAHEVMEECELGVEDLNKFLRVLRVIGGVLS